MKIAIISDSHDNIPNIEKFLAWAKTNDIGMIIHCGDIAAPAVVVKEFAAKFSGPIHLIFGNVADRETLTKVSAGLAQVILDGDEGEIEADGKKIAFCHFPEQAKKLAQSGRHHLVFYGHTHKPWIETVGRTQLVNPGTLGGLFQKASFAVYDTISSKLDLKILETL